MVDCFSKIAHFIPCNKTFDMSNMASPYYLDIFRLRGISLTKTSDWDSKFPGHFWKTIRRKLGTQPKLNTTVHSKTKIVNRNLDNLLRSSIGKNIGNCQSKLGQSTQKLYWQEHLIVVLATWNSPTTTPSSKSLDAILLKLPMGGSNQCNWLSTNSNRKQV